MPGSALAAIALSLLLQMRRRMSSSLTTSFLSSLLQRSLGSGSWINMDSLIAVPWVRKDRTVVLERHLFEQLMYRMHPTNRSEQSNAVYLTTSSRTILLRNLDPTSSTHTATGCGLALLCVDSWLVARHPRPASPSAVTGSPVSKSGCQWRKL
jgi:hypothetical protein